MLALRFPAAPGLKRTEIVQAAPGDRVAAIGQSLLWSKSAAFVPRRAMFESVTATVPVFWNVIGTARPTVPTVCRPSLRLTGTALTEPTTVAVVPVPVNATACDPGPASSAIVRVAVSVPVADGVNVTATEQLAVAASVWGASGQLVVPTKSSALAPLVAMPLIVSGALPEFVTVTLCAGLEVPTT